ncbi:MAG: efflux RND transporter permease subunit [Deltaproteobacteria bacterium]|nr:efflux RND transporter permease subunit [Deltaproteobacteria bacterium]
MIDRIIRWSVLHPWVVLVLSLAAGVAGWRALRDTPLDAIPDLSDTQVILLGEWMGVAPDRLESQVARPVASALVATPKVKAVRAYTMYGMVFFYAIFDDGTDAAWARSRIQEQLGQMQALLPVGPRLSLGPDASGVGWAFQYALVDDAGAQDLAALRTLQETTLRNALASVPGVAEVAAVGGFRRQVQIDVNPGPLAAHGLSLDDVARAAQAAVGDQSAGLIEMSQREYFVRIAGNTLDLDVLRRTPVGSNPARPVTLGDVATVGWAPQARRGTADWDGMGETVSGIVVVRAGENVLGVLDRVKARLEELKPALPEGVRVVPVYDRSNLIRRAVETLTGALVEQLAVVIVVILVFLAHLRSTLVAVVMLPLAVLLAFVPMRQLGVTANLMSLGGIALAIGDLVDAAVVLIDDAHRKLERTPNPTRQQRIDAILQACRGMGPPIFFSLLLLVVSFLPVFALQGQGRRLFEPLAMTKTFAMAAAAILSITLAPALVRLFVRGHIVPESQQWLSRVLIKLYRPMAWAALHNPKTTLLMGVFAVLSAIPVARGLGSEFMPALDEGDLLYMPTTANGIAIDEAQRLLQTQDRAIRAFPEVQSVLGKAGRAETSTDPAPLSMIETVIQLKPRDQWRKVAQQCWWHKDKGVAADWVPAFATALLERLCPSERPLTLDELATQMQAGLDQAGWTHAWTKPIKARIDMLATGIRTPVGVKVYGKDLPAIDAAAGQLVRAVGKLPGTRSAFAERNLGQYYVDIEPDRAALARHGLLAGDLGRLLALAVGGQTVATLPDGRSTVDVQVRLAKGFRDSRAELEMLPIAVPRPALAGAANPASPAGGDGMAAMSGGMGTGSGTGTGTGTGTGSGTGTGTGTGTGSGTGTGTGTAAPVANLTVPLRDLAKVVVREGPPMIKTENAQPVGYVYIDVDADRTDIGAWVAAAKHKVQAAGLPAGTRLEWTGQYELLLAMQERMQTLVPLTLGLMLLLLWLNFGNLAQPLIVLGTVPFALVGSVWLLGWLDYRLSTAVWVGLIALVGVAAETGVVMILYLDESWQRWKDEGRLRTVEDLRMAVLEGAVQRVRPKLMTVAMNVVGLGPVLWAEGTGAEVTRRICAPLVGGLVTSTFLTLEIIPVVYFYWRRWQMHTRAP